jgi:curved DNA-binding protein CbpA
MTLRLLPYTPERDAYRLLGLPPTASTDEIGAACRRLARTFHPDHNGSPRATEEMQVVNAVRTVMTDPAWRATYDRERHRFHARRTRAAAARPAMPTFAPSPLRLEARPASAVARYARALAIGVRAAVGGLLPARCGRCRTVIEAVDSYCAACGIPLLGSRSGPAR